MSELCAPALILSGLSIGLSPAFSTQHSDLEERRVLTEGDEPRTADQWSGPGDPNAFYLVGIPVPTKLDHVGVDFALNPLKGLSFVYKFLPRSSNWTKYTSGCCPRPQPQSFDIGASLGQLGAQDVDHNVSLPDAVPTLGPRARVRLRAGPRCEIAGQVP